MLFQVFLSLCFLLVQSVYCNDEAEDDSVFKYLKVDPKTVEQHDLARMTLNDSQANKVQLGFRVFGKDINVWLHPADSYLFTNETLVYKAQTENHKTQFYRITRVWINLIGELFESDDHLASVVIGSNDDGSTINGHIQLTEENLMIRSLPHDVAKQYLRKRRSAETPVEPHPNMAYHIALKLKKPLKDELPFASRMKNKRSTELMECQVIGEKNQANKTLYPEILVFADYSFSDDWGGKNLEQFYSFLEYLMAFWNGVDLIYRNIDDPKIRLHIAALVLCTDPYAPSYMHYIHVANNTVVNVPRSLPEAAIYFYEYPKFYDLNWDIAVTMTKWSLGYSDNDREILGQAYFNKACRRGEEIFRRPSGQITANATMGQAFVKDNGAFFGIPVAAHEIAHTLGVGHDHVSTYPTCDERNGFIMAPVMQLTTNGHSLSVCSLYQIQQEQRTTNKYKCLTNKPYSEWAVKLPQLMPGRIAGWDKQCQVVGYKKGACRSEKVNDVCVRLWCQVNDEICSPIGLPAADGTPCPDPDARGSRFCLQSRCTSLN